MDQLNTDLEALATALSNVQADVSALPTPTDPNDGVVASFVTVLTNAGYTVTPPAELPASTSIPVTDGNESTTEDATDTSTES